MGEVAVEPSAEVVPKEPDAPDAGAADVPEPPLHPAKIAANYHRQYHWFINAFKILHFISPFSDLGKNGAIDCSLTGLVLFPVCHVNIRC